MNRIVYFLIVALLCVSCRSQQRLINGNEQLLDIPCSSIVSDAFTTRALGTSTSSNIQGAKDKAAVAARNELASTMQTSVQRVVDTYAESYEGDTLSRFISITQDISRLTSYQVLVGSTIACEKITQTIDKKTKKVLYHAYVVVEIDNRKILKSLEQKLETAISQGDTFPVDLELEKLQQLFHNEIEKLHN